MRRRVAVLIIPALVALGLTSCGGGEEGKSGERPLGAQPENGMTSTVQRPAKAAPAGQRQNGAASGAATTRTGEGSATPAAKSHKDSGGGSAQFLGRGDNSVQESGSEAANSEFVQAAAALHGYLNARAAGRWKAACSYVSAGLRDSLEQLGASGQGQNRGNTTDLCAAAIKALSAGAASAAAQEAVVADPGALRVRGDHGFLLFHGADRSGYFMPMAREAGRWKVAGLAPSPLS